MNGYDRRVDTIDLKKDWIEQLVVWDEPILKPIGGHLGKTTRSSVFVSISYCEASEIGLECRQYVPLNVNITKLFCGLRSMILLLPILEIQWRHKKVVENFVM